MRVKTDNVERVVSDEYGRELVASKKAVEVPEKEVETNSVEVPEKEVETNSVEVPEKEVETNSLEKLKVDELKALASEKGIEGAATMKKSELLDILKDVV